jgi:hypothetical protein
MLNENNLQESQRLVNNEKELRAQIVELENSLSQARREKEQMKIDLHNEIEKITRTHQEAVKMLREESQDLERKYFDELAAKRRETDAMSQREAQYMQTIQELREEILSLKEKIKSSTHRRMSSEKKSNSRYQKNYYSPAKGYNSETEESEYFKRSRDLESASRFHDLDTGAKNVQFIKLRNRIESLESQLSVYEKKISDLEKERVNFISENERLTLIVESQKSIILK